MRQSPWLALLAAILLVGACVSPAPTTRGQVEGSGFEPGELLQSEGNRLVQAAMQANLQSLRLLAGKLYLRNPVQWQKTAATREDALERLDTTLLGGAPWPELQGQRDIAALSLALSPGFQGDRVAALIAACADIIVTAHGGRQEFYYLNGVDAQHVYNAARNMEIALWILNSRHTDSGAPLLLANEISEAGRNLSFEREFGKIIARLDLVASVATERHRRAAINYVQTLLAAPLLAFLPVR